MTQTSLGGRLFRFSILVCPLDFVQWSPNHVPSSWTTESMHDLYPSPPPFHKSIFITDDSLSGWITAATAWYHDLGIQVVGNGRFFKFEKRDSAGACLFEFTSPSCSIEVISRIEMERMNDLDFITTMKPMWFENQTWNDYLRFSED